MKVLLVNSYDRGGAAQACIRLHLALLKAGIHSNLLLLHSENPDLPAANVFKNPPSPQKHLFFRIWSKLRRGLVLFKLLKPLSPYLKNENNYRASRENGLEGISFPNSKFDITTSHYYAEADIVHFHWVGDFLDWESFFTLNTKPVIWTLHDQNPFLGANHYEEKMFGVDTNGFPVKRKISDTEAFWESVITAYKKKWLKKSTSSLTIVCPSRWLLNESSASELFNRYPHFNIPYGIDIKIFKPLNKKYARDLLCLPQNKKIIGFVSDAISNNRKGYQYLVKAIEHLREEQDVLLCAVGRNENTNQSEHIYYLGNINDQRLMSVIYNALDLFVIPSLEDNLPNTVLESLCCGTPVAGFEIGGLPDMVKNGVNGMLSKTVSVGGLLNIIKEALLLKLDTAAIANNAALLYEDSVQAKAYIELYAQTTATVG